MTGPTAPHGPSFEDELLAADMALNALSGPILQATLRRLETDADFARLVETWRARLLSEDHGFGSEPPPPDVWDRIATRIDLLGPPG